MSNVLVTLNERGHGAFYITDRDERIAEMVISVSGSYMTVYHTEVFEKGEGQGLGKQLLETMVKYARKHQLKVIPLCPYVLAQFKRHPELYNDVWNKT